MARSRGAAPARSSGMKATQTRTASTAAYPPTRLGPVSAQPPAPYQAQPQAQAPGLFGQMASTAAGVAVGSSIGHAIGGLFSGGSSAPAAVDNVSPQQQQLQQSYQSGMDQQSSLGACQPDILNFRKCMNENQGDLNICSWYLDQLKACQQAAGQY